MRGMAMNKETMYRIESDSLGEIKVLAERYYGAQTQRSIQNFPIGNDPCPIDLIYAIAQIKKSAATTHLALGLLSEGKTNAIVQACDEIINREWDAEFPLSVWQSGSGTQTHMNVNEVIANRSNELLGGEKGIYHPIHPNDDINKSQSTNDVFSSAIQIASLQAVMAMLLPAAEKLYSSLIDKKDEFSHTITIGRTHMGDAVPMYLGQRFSGYADQIKQCIDSIRSICEPLSEIPIGGTAIGTCINLPSNYIKLMLDNLNRQLGLSLSTCKNFFSHQAALDLLVNTSGSLNSLSCPLIKIANDIRLMSSGPRCGLGEISVPVNEPGSSIMPGKINPTQCEVLIMVATRVQGNHVTITNANSLINFEAHSFRPVIIYSLLQSIQLLTDAMNSFVDRCLSGILVNEEILKKQLDHSLALATALNPTLGYEKSCQVAKKAHAENITLKQAAIALGLLTEDECNKLLDPKNML